MDPQTGKDIPTRGDKPGTGCVGSLSLSKEVFQVQGPFLCGRMGTEHCTYEIAFPNKGTSIYRLNQVSVENRKRKVSKSLQYPIF